MKNSKRCFAWMPALLAMALCGCASQPESSADGVCRIVFDAAAGECPAGELFAGAEVVPLTLPEGGVLPVVHWGQEAGGEWYLTSISDRIYRFDRTGRLLNVIGRPGRGPGEWEQIHSVTVSGDTVWVWDGFAARLHAYLKDGTFAGEESLSRRATSVYKDGDAVWAYLNYANDYGPERVVSLDAAGNVTAAMLPSAAQMIQVSENRPVFIRCGERLLFRECYSSDVYALSQQGAQLACHVDFGENAIREEIFSMERMAGAMALLESDWAVLDDYVETDGHIVVRAAVNRAGGAGGWYWGFFDKRSGDTVWCGTEAAESMFDHAAMFAAGDDTLALALYAAQARELLASMPAGTVSGAETLASLADDENVLLLCRLK